MSNTPEKMKRERTKLRFKPKKYPDGYRLPARKKFWVPIGTGYLARKKFWVPMGTGPEKNWVFDGYWVPTRKKIWGIDGYRIPGKISLMPIPGLQLTFLELRNFKAKAVKIARNYFFKVFL